MVSLDNAGGRTRTRWLEAVCTVAVGMGGAAGCTVTRDAGALTTSESVGAGSTTGDWVGTAGSPTTLDDNSTGGAPDKLDISSPDVPQMLCASVEQSTIIAEGPSDIIIVVDRALEPVSLDSTLANFSELIGDGDIEDVRVVLLSGYPPDGACIDAPPLGIEQCPLADDNPPMYRHFDETIEGDTLLTQVLSTHSQWAATMRSDAWKHIWILSSQDASMPTEEFREAFAALDATYARHTVHVMAPMVIEAGGDCSGVSAGQAWANAPEYEALAMQTGGVFENMCNYNLKVLFEELLDRIQTVALSCVYDIPPPPDGLLFDKGKVNVDFDDGFGSLTVGYVEDPALCPGVGNGWHYDNVNAPSQILMCPQTCSRFESLEVASVEIRFGCTTVPAG